MPPVLTAEDISRIGETVREVTRPQFDLMRQEISYMHERFSYMHEQFGYMHEKFRAVDRHRERIEEEMVTRESLEARLRKFQSELGS